RFPKQALVDMLEKSGVAFGADLNASTSFDETLYTLAVPTDKPELLGKSIEVLRDWAGDVTFDPTEVDEERGVVMEEWRLGRGAVPDPAHAEALFSVETDPVMPQTAVTIITKLPHRPLSSVRDERRAIAEQLFSSMVNARLDEIRRKPNAPFLGASSRSGGFV